MNIRLKQTYALLANDVETPISHFIRHIGDKEGLLLESVEVDGRRGRFSIIAGEFLLCLSCRDGSLALSIRDPRLRGLARYQGLPFVQGVREVMGALEITADIPEGVNRADLPPITRGLYGYFGYGMAGIFEPKLAAILPPAEAEACLVLPGAVTLFDHVYNRVCRLSLVPSADAPGAEAHAPCAAGQATIGEARASMTKAEYTRVVRDIQQRLEQGEGMQVVPSIRFEAPFSGDPFTLYRRLRVINPSPYLFYMRLPEITLMGSSPEVLVGCADGELYISPIAGTRPRGETAREDNLFEEELVRDPKERAEHVMLVDLARNDLGKVAVPGSVTLDRYMEVERFSHVMHLTSYISATLAPELDALDVLMAAFPAGTVSGAPKIRAMEIIAESEPSARGPYAGAIGWIGLDKGSVNMDTGITIRSLWIQNGTARWQAGAGIVIDSSPEAEWKECGSKAEAMARAVRE